MSTKAQLQAVIDGYREELAVTRLQHKIETDEWEKTLLAQVETIGSLDREAERQEERILALEDRRDGMGVEMAVTAEEYQPKIPYEAQEAIFAVALMLDNRAETMAVGVGADLNEYTGLCERSHRLKAEVDMFRVNGAGHGLYEFLTSPW